MQVSTSHVAETSEEITALVERPPSAIALADFTREIYRHEIRVLTDGPSELLHDPALLGAVRGALGGELRRTASKAAEKGMACPWRPACALDVLWGKRRATATTEVPAPYLLFTEPAEDGLLVIGLALFGIASGWSGAVADALTAAASEGVWLPGRQKLTMTVLDREIRAVQGVAVPGAQPNWTLEFLTPLRLLREGQLLDAEALAVNGGVFGGSLGNRATGFARWHGLRLEANWPAIKTLWEAVTVQFDEMQRAKAVPRRSARTGQRTRYDGWIGRMTIANLDPALTPLLGLGVCLHAGGAGTAGLGRFVLKPV